MEPLTYDLIKSRCCVNIPEQEQYLLCYKNVNLHFIIIMKKILPTENDFGTITNEQRNSVINISTCKCRANKLLVLKIVDYLTGEEFDKMINKNQFYISPDIKTTTYIKNEIVYPDYFDNNLDIICGAGIHYYNSLDPCIFSRYESIRTYKYNGKLKIYCEDGGLKEDLNFINGKKHGICQIYNNRGELSCIKNYIDNIEISKDFDEEIYDGGKTKILYYKDGGKRLIFFNIKGEIIFETYRSPFVSKD